MYSALVIIQVFVSLALVTFVLLQQGKGADAGAAFGAGASGTVFGSRGSANFFSRATAVCAALFMGISLALAYLVHDASQTEGGSVVDELVVEETEATTDAPAIPEVPEGGAAEAAPAEAAPDEETAGPAEGGAVTVDESAGKPPAIPE